MNFRYQAPNISHWVIVKLIIFTALITGNVCSAGEKIQIDESLKKLNIESQVEVFEDKYGLLTFEDIVSDKYSGEFRKNDNGRLNYGFTRSTFWIKIETENRSWQPVDWYLAFDYASVDYLTLYIPTKNGYKIIKTGDQYPFSRRPVQYRNFIFPLTEFPGGHTYYLKVTSNGSMVCPLNALSPEAFKERSDYEMVLLWIFYGMLLTISIYNFSIFFAVKERAYLYLVFFIASIALFSMCQNGFASQYFWPNSVNWGNFSTPLSVLIGGFSGMAFTRAFLNTREFVPLLDKILLGLMGLILAGTCSVFFIEYFVVIHIALFLGMTSFILMFYSGFATIRKNFRTSFIYLLSYILYIAGASLLFIKLLGIGPIYSINNWGYQLGLGLLALLLSLGVADKIHNMRLQSEQALKSMWENEKKYREIFENVKDWIFVHDFNGVLVETNRYQILEMGYGGNKSGTINFRNMIPSPYRDNFDDYINRILRNGSEQGVTSFISRNGERRVLEYNNSVVYDESGPKAVRGVARDITERLESEKRLKESEARYRTVLDHIENGYFEVDTGGNITFINNALSRLFKLSEEKLAGLNVIPLMEREDAKKFVNVLKKLSRNSKSIEIFDWKLTVDKGESLHAETTMTAATDSKGKVTGFRGIVRDVTERKKHEDRLVYLAYHDALTGLFNRKAFMEKLGDILVHAKRYRDEVAVLFIDLDRFKKVNDTFGHEAGDFLLKEVAARLNNSLRESDYICRIGGDEFTIILNDKNNIYPEIIAEKIRETLSLPYIVDSIVIDFITPSIGISRFPEDGEDIETLIRTADKAMYRAKKTTNSCVSFSERPVLKALR